MTLVAQFMLLDLDTFCFCAVAVVLQVKLLYRVKRETLLLVNDHKCL